MTENQFYWDANIWLDIYEKRGHNGELTKQMLRKNIMEDDLIFYSDLVVAELFKVGYSQMQISEILSVAKPGHLKKVPISKKQVAEAMKIARMWSTARADALHAILARDNQLQMITRDADFQRLKHITRPKLPEDFL